MAALAEDHLNDVMSNAGAIATAAVASLWSHGWCVCFGTNVFWH